MIKQTICTLVAALTFNSCSPKDNKLYNITIPELKSGEYKGKLVKIHGDPVSVSTGVAGNDTQNGYLSIVLRGGNNTVLASCSRTNAEKVIDAQSLINAEKINPDKGPITLIGRYNSKKLYIDSMNVNGYGINFK